MHAGHWDKATHKSTELHGRTIGLVGLGAIGRRFARMCDAISPPDRERQTLCSDPRPRAPGAG